MTKRKEGSTSSGFLDDVDVSGFRSFAARHLTRDVESNVLISGATGFVGRWALAALSSFREQYDARIRVTAAVRDPSRAADLLRFLSNDLPISCVPIDEVGSTQHVDQIWHFAAYTGTSSAVPALDIIDADVGLTLELLRLASRQPRPPRFLYTSSGAVYGRGRLDSRPASELDSLEVPETAVAYDRAKLASEILLTAAARDGIIEARIARLFAFVGQLLPLTAHFAIGNFIADAAAGRTVRVRSGGVDHRSWMYAGDMANVLLGMAFGTAPEVMNVGSGESMTIASAAERIARLAGVDFVIEGDRSVDPTFYVPDVGLLDSVFPKLHPKTFDDAALRTLTWAQSNPSSLRDPEAG